MLNDKLTDKTNVWKQMNIWGGGGREDERADR